MEVTIEYIKENCITIGDLQKLNEEMREDESMGKTETIKKTRSW